MGRVIPKKKMAGTKKIAATGSKTACGEGLLGVAVSGNVHEKNGW